MAKLVLTNAAVTVDSVDISDHVQTVTIPQTIATVDVSSMGAEFTEYALGLADSTWTITVFNDFAAASIDSQMQAIFDAKAAVEVVVLPSGTAVGSANPSRTMTAFLTEYNPIDGSVANAVTTNLVFVNATQSGVTRATS